jgi:hypothetical protein
VRAVRCHGLPPSALTPSSPLAACKKPILARIARRE